MTSGMIRNARSSIVVLVPRATDPETANDVIEIIRQPARTPPHNMMTREKPAKEYIDGQRPSQSNQAEAIETAINIHHRSNCLVQGRQTSQRDCKSHTSNRQQKTPLWLQSKHDCEYHANKGNQQHEVSEGKLRFLLHARRPVP